MSTKSTVEKVLDLHQFQWLKKHTDELHRQLFRLLEQEDWSTYECSESCYKSVHALCGPDQVLNGFFACHFQVIGYACVAHHEMLCELGNQSHSALRHLVSLTDLKVHHYEPGDYTALKSFVNLFQSSLLSIIFEHSTSLRGLITAHYDSVKRFVTELRALPKRFILGSYSDEHINVLSGLIEQNKKTLKKFRYHFAHCFSQQKTTQFGSLQESIENLNNIKIFVESLHKEGMDNLAQAYLSNLGGLVTYHNESIQKYHPNSVAYQKFINAEGGLHQWIGPPNTNSADGMFPYPLKLSSAQVSTPQPDLINTRLPSSSFNCHHSCSSVPNMPIQRQFLALDAKRKPTEDLGDCKEFREISEHKETVVCRKSYIPITENGVTKSKQHYSLQTSVVSYDPHVTSSMTDRWPNDIYFPGKSVSEPAFQSVSGFNMPPSSMEQFGVSRFSNNLAYGTDFNQPSSSTSSSISSDETNNYRYSDQSTKDHMLSKLSEHMDPSMRFTGTMADLDNSRSNLCHTKHGVDFNNHRRHYVNTNGQATNDVGVIDHFQGRGFKDFESSMKHPTQQSLQSYDVVMPSYFGPLQPEPLVNHDDSDSMRMRTKYSSNKRSSVLNRDGDNIKNRGQYSHVKGVRYEQESTSPLNQTVEIGPIGYSKRSNTDAASRIAENDDVKTIPTMSKNISENSQEVLSLSDKQDERAEMEFFSQKTRSQFSNGYAIPSYGLNLQNEAKLLALRYYNKDPVARTLLASDDTESLTSASSKKLLLPAENPLDTFDNSKKSRAYRLLNFDNPDNKVPEKSKQDEKTKSSNYHSEISSTSQDLTSNNELTSLNSVDAFENSKCLKDPVTVSSERASLVSSEKSGPLPGVKKSNEGTLTSSVGPTQNQEITSLEPTEISSSTPMSLMKSSKYPINFSSPLDFPDPLEGMEYSITKISAMDSMGNDIKDLKGEAQRGANDVSVKELLEENDDFYGRVTPPETLPQTSTKGKSNSLKRKSPRKDKFTKKASLKALVPKPVFGEVLSSQPSHSFPLRPVNIRASLPVFLQMSSNVGESSPQTAAPAVPLIPEKTTLVPVYIQSYGVQTLAPLASGITETTRSVPVFSKFNNETSPFVGHSVSFCNNQVTDINQNHSK